MTVRLRQERHTTSHCCAAPPTIIPVCSVQALNSLLPGLHLQQAGIMTPQTQASHHQACPASHGAPSAAARPWPASIAPPPGLQRRLPAQQDLSGLTCATLMTMTCIARQVLQQKHCAACLRPQPGARLPLRHGLKAGLNQPRQHKAMIVLPLHQTRRLQQCQLLPLPPLQLTDLSCLIVSSCKAVALPV